MATKAVVYFDSHITLDELAGFPVRLVNECPKFVEFFEGWGWPVDPSRFEWCHDWDTKRPELETASARWNMRKEVGLYGPGGHLHFGPNWLQWSSHIKWRWLFDSQIERDELTETAAQLAALAGSSVAIITADGGDEDAVLDVLEAGGTVLDAAELLRRKGEPALSLLTITDPGHDIPGPRRFIIRYK